MSLSDDLSFEVGSEVRLKCEHRQTTGSFKLRGALNKTLILPRQRLDEGVVVASTGNHGAAVAYACRLLGGKCVVFVPEDVRNQKEEAMLSLGADIRKHGVDGLEAELFARQWAENNGIVYISPYNDLDVITGQATVARELLEHVDDDWSIYVAVGGGGLIAGVAAVLKSAYPDIRIVGCSPENHPVMDESVKTGRIVDLPYRRTLSDGTAGRLEEDAVTLPLCSLLVDDWIRVSEAEIAESIRFLAKRERMIVEGSSAVAVGALRKDYRSDRRKRLAVLCGGNIDRPLLKRILADEG